MSDLDGSAARPAGHLRVVSFNVRNGIGVDGWNSWPFRRRATAAAITSLRPDVACLQEVHGFQLRWLRRRLPEMVALGAPRGDGRRRGERCPVLVDAERLRVRRVQTRWFGPTPDRPGTRLPGAAFPRIATLVVVEEADGRPFGVAGTHLDSRVERNRVQAAEQLLSWLDPDLPWIVAGDLNARPGSRPLEVLQEGGLMPALPADAPGTDHRFTGRHDGPRLDHLLVTAGWSVHAGWVALDRPGGRLPSDHWPVVADLSLEA